MPSIHATAVAIGGEALLIVGPSRAGKSRLAAGLIARATTARPIALIGDDRILLSEKAKSLVARPHPRIAGFLERRGLGIVAMAWVAEAPVAGVVELRDDGRSPISCRHFPHPAPPQGAGSSVELEKEGLGQDVARLVLAPEHAEADIVLAWWTARDAAAASHLPWKRAGGDWTCAKD